MCLIIHAGKKQPIPHHIVQTAIPRNKDGWGVVWHANGHTHSKKSLDMTKLEPFLKKIEDYERLVHLRLRTQGQVTLDNCHPFKIHEGLYFMHNGMMSEFNDVKEGLSDTALFAYSILKPAANGRPHDEVLTEFWFRSMIDHYAGTHQRFALMDAMGRVHRSGSWTHHASGVWLSNTYAWGEVKKYQTTCYPQRSYGGTHTDLADVTKWRGSKDYDKFWADSVTKYHQENGTAPKLSNDSYQDSLDSEASAVTTLEFTADDLKGLPDEDIQMLETEHPDFMRGLLRGE